MSQDSSLTFEDYQLQAPSTAIYPGAGTGNLMAVVYTALGLANEGGETAGKVKKILRDSKGVLSEESRKSIADEIGDVLWYAALLADEIGWSLEKIASNNLDKLSDRNNRGVLGGSGDNR